RVLDLQPARKHRHVGDEADVLHQGVALAGRVAAQHLQFAFVGNQAEGGLQGGGLAGAVGADQADDAAGGDLEVDAVDGDRAVVALAEIAGGDDGAHRCVSLAAFMSRSMSRPRRWMRSTTCGHSSLRKRSRSVASSFSRAPSVTYMPSPLRFSTSSSSASSW